MTLITLREHYVKMGSQEAGAADLGVSTNHYQLWLCGRFKPCWKSIQKLAQKGISIEQFPD